MSSTEHGLSCGIKRVNDQFYMHIKIVGKLSHADYEIMVPMLENAIDGVSEPNVNVFVDMTEFQGWELRAAWDDLKLGLRHNRDFAKIAVLGNKKWEEYAIRVSSWFSHGEMHYFENSQEALAWLGL